MPTCASPAVLLPCVAFFALVAAGAVRQTDDDVKSQQQLTLKYRKKAVLTRRVSSGCSTALRRSTSWYVQLPARTNVHRARYVTAERTSSFGALARARAVGHLRTRAAGCTPELTALVYVAAELALLALLELVSCYGHGALTGNKQRGCQA
jgi:hypothetical protein